VSRLLLPARLLCQQLAVSRGAVSQQVQQTVQILEYIRRWVVARALARAAHAAPPF
jgi:hypothetical protein